METNNKEVEEQGMKFGEGMGTPNIDINGQ